MDEMNNDDVKVEFDECAVNDAIRKIKMDRLYTDMNVLYLAAQCTNDLPIATAVLKNFTMITKKELCYVLESLLPLIKRCKEIDAKYGFSKEESDGD